MLMLLSSKSNLGVNKYFHYKKYASGSGGLGININPGGLGKTILIMWCDNQADGDKTYSQIGMIRCGYNGNHFSFTEIAYSAGSGLSANKPTYSVNSNGELTTDRTGCYLVLSCTSL